MLDFGGDRRREIMVLGGPSIEGQFEVLEFEGYRTVVGSSNAILFYCIRGIYLLSLYFIILLTGAPYVLLFVFF